MTHRWIVTVLGKDRPGIVAGATKVLYALGANLEDSAMTRLAGEFAILLIFSAPASVTDQRLRQAFDRLKRQQQLSLNLKPLTKLESRAPKARGIPYLISVYGADRPGIVYRVSQALAHSRINITDVQTHRSDLKGKRSGSAFYLMLLEVELPPGVKVTSLERTLGQLGRQLGVEVSMRGVESHVL